jgi:ABC-2 type transport system ATP-binding protein
VDRPRRALAEEPDDVESYVARRSRGFTSADNGDHLATRPARAAQALEPAVSTHPSPESDQLGFSDPVPRPRRAVLPEPLLSGPLLPDAGKEKTAATEAGIGRRAMDLLPSRYAEPAVRLEPAAPAAPTPSVASPPPRRSAPSASFEPVIERAPASGYVTSPDNPSPARPQPPHPHAPVAPPPVSMPSPVPTAPPVSPRPTPAAASGPPPPISQAARVSPPMRQAASVTPPASTVTPASPSVPTPAPASWRVPTPPPTSQPAPAPLTTPTAYVPLRPAPSQSAPPPASRVAQPSARSAPPQPQRTATSRDTTTAAVRRGTPSRWVVDHEVPSIIIDRLIKSYNGVLAVHNLSFVVEPGRVTGFLGPNGAGKTTTMRILVGLATPTTGTATFGELAYADLSHPQQTVGCVLDASFHPARTGRNHLRVLAPTAGVSDRRVDKLLGQVGLGKVARQPVGEYSTGMRQRLALAAAMLGDPDYLILDEPANGLDPQGMRWLRGFLREFAATGRAVLISSHQLSEIEATADDIVVINKGRLLAQLPMSELNLGDGTTRARVSDMRAAVHALGAIGADVQTAADERGAYLRIQSPDVSRIGAVLFNSGIVVDELITERRDLEQEFFSMLEGSR